MPGSAGVIAPVSMRHEYTLAHVHVADVDVDMAYASPALERAICESDMSRTPRAVSLVSLARARASSSALSATGSMVWVRAAPPGMAQDDTSMSIYVHPSLATDAKEAAAAAVAAATSDAQVAVRGVEPMALTAVYVSVPPPDYERLSADLSALRDAWDGHILWNRSTYPVLDTQARIVMTEPVEQGVVESATTRLFVVRDDTSAAPDLGATTSRTPGSRRSDADASDAATDSMSATEAVPVVDERFLAPEDAKPLPHSFHARIVPRSQLVCDAIEAWKQRNNNVYVDDASVVLVREQALLSMAIFDGSWAIVRAVPDHRPHVVRVFATYDASLALDDAYVPPMLLQNLCTTESFDPLRSVTLQLEPSSTHLLDEAASVPCEQVSAFPAKPPFMPFAEYVCVARVSTPISTDQTYIVQCDMALRQYLFKHPRILRQGDILAVAIDARGVRYVRREYDRSTPPEQLAEIVWKVDMPGVPVMYLRHAIYYCVTDITPRMTNPESLDEAVSPAYPALRQWYMDLVARGSIDSLGCWLDARQACVEQKDAVSRRVADVRTWHNLVSETPPCPPDGTCLTQPGTPFARLCSLVNAILSDEAQSMGLHLHVLLDGARGVGKRTLVHWVAQRTGVHVFEIACSLLANDSDSPTEGVLTGRALRARTCAPCILLLRDIDALIRKGATGSELGGVTKMVKSCIDVTQEDLVMVVATCEDAAHCPRALRALFNESLRLDPPPEKARAEILRTALASHAVGADVDVPSLALQTAALLPADLQDMVARACLASIERVAATQPTATMGDIVAARPLILAADLDRALAQVRGSYSQSIGAPKIPNVTWDDVGGLASVKNEILDTVQLPLEHPELFADGVKKRSGVLLYGPPGTGKTLLAKAVATTCSLNFFSVKGPELLNMYIGESEANVRRVFQRARDAKPCVIFFDELDSIAPKRGRHSDSSGVMNRIVSQLLAELDGMASGSAASEVFVIGATNRPDLLDPALLRPGRFDRLLYLSVAETDDAQLNILQALTRKFALDEDVGDMRVIAQQCPFNLTGADFYALCSDAMLKAMTEKAAEVDAAVARVDAEPRTGERAHWPKPMSVPFYLAKLAKPHEVHVRVHRRHFESALKDLTPSVSPQEMAHYREVQRTFSQPQNKSTTPTTDSSASKPLPKSQPQSQSQSQSQLPPAVEATAAAVAAPPPPSSPSPHRQDDADQVRFEMLGEERQKKALTTSASKKKGKSRAT